jgi:hypothetical protein
MQPIIAPRSTVEVSTRPALATVVVVDTRLDDLFAFAEALLEPGVIDYEDVRRELGLDE